MAGERRKYLRVLFEETITVETDEWTDPMATGLDISLNGTRFHCEHSLNEGDVITIGVRPDFKLQGEVRWCWPIEWYYQAAVEFTEINEDEQQQLKDYISEVTGEPYPDYSEEAPPAPSSDDDNEDDLEEIEIPDLDDEDDDIFDNDPLIDDDLDELPLSDADEDLDDDMSSDDDSSSEATGEFSPMMFNQKRVAIMSANQEHTDLLAEYLQSRCGLEVSSVKKRTSLWPLMKAHPSDILLVEWQEDGQEALEIMEELSRKYPSVLTIFLAGPTSLEDRLNALNAGAKDFITRPVHLSSIAQSILYNLYASGVTSSGNRDDSGGEDDLELPDDFMDDDLDLTDDLDEL